MNLAQALQCYAANLGGIPSLSSAAVWLNYDLKGTVGDYYYTDVIRGRRFNLTDMDFPVGWMLGLPYKTNAKISAPAGDAELIALDTTNFWYDSLGNPRLIPVNSLSQDIDLVHTTFNRHIGRVTDGFGRELFQPTIAETVIYSTPRTGLSLAECRNYFNVPAEVTTNVRWVVPGGANTGTGSTRATGWETLQYAEDNATAGDTVYVVTNSLTEDDDVNHCWYCNKDLTWISLGDVEVKPAAAATHGMLVGMNKTISFTGFTFNALGKQSSFRTNGRGSYQVTSNRCKFFGGVSGDHEINLYNTNAGIVFNDCIVYSNQVGFSSVRVEAPVDLIGCWFGGIARSATSNSTLSGSGDINHYYCDFVGTYAFGASNMTVVNQFNSVYRYCYFKLTTGYCVAMMNQYGLDFQYNTLDMGPLTTNGIVAQSTGTAMTSCIIRNNVVNVAAGVGRWIFIGQTSSGAGNNKITGVDVDYNILICTKSPNTAIGGFIGYQAGQTFGANNTFTGFNTPTQIIP